MPRKKRIPENQLGLLNMAAYILIRAPHTVQTLSAYYRIGAKPGGSEHKFHKRDRAFLLKDGAFVIESDRGTPERALYFFSQDFKFIAPENVSPKQRDEAEQVLQVFWRKRAYELAPKAWQKAYNAAIQVSHSHAAAVREATKAKTDFITQMTSPVPAAA